jgi:hypothetical protein
MEEAQMSATQTTISTSAFPEAEIQSRVRELLTEESQIQAHIHGGHNGGGATAVPGRVAPHIDSLVAVEILVEIETFVPFELSENLIRPGGYTSVDDFINDFMPKVRERWQEHHKG